MKQCQELPPFGLEGMLPRTRRAIWMRNLSMRMMTRWPVRNLVTGMFLKADAIVLEDYVASALPELAGTPPNSRAQGPQRHILERTAAP